MTITTIEPIRKPGELICFLPGCSKKAACRLIIDDNGITIKICTCPGCATLPVREIVNGALPRYEKRPGIYDGRGDFVSSEP